MAGRASRREAERFLLEGRIEVNGVRVSELGTRVVPGRDRVVLDGDEVRVDAEPRWVVLHKPAGVLTTRGDPYGGRTVYDVLPPELATLRYLGRLDRDTEGLLIFSNQGDVIHGLLHPSREIEREYLAWVVGVPTGTTLARLEAGVELGDGPARAALAELVGREGDRSVVKLVLTEGRKREVRRLLDAVGHRVVRLLRVRFGPLELGSLPSGAWRALTRDEIDLLLALTGRG
jgi:23S rRNA pseudouridine2605 synthase/16S rRNA pseudouridine516 synthase